MEPLCISNCKEASQFKLSDSQPASSPRVREVSEVQQTSWRRKRSVQLMTQPGLLPPD